MLVIISDLHLNDGTFGETLSPSVFRALCNRLTDLAYRASWRAGGRYRPIETLDLLLLGDVFDCTQSFRWHEYEPGSPEYARPWDDPDSPALIATFTDIMRGILRNNAAVFRIFRQLSNGTRISLPPAMDNHLPGKHALPRVPVKVNIHYMVGNHDWCLHLPGPEYNALRAEVADALGLVTDAAVPFPYLPEESPVLERVLRSHRVFARHGDIFDPLNYNQACGRNAASLMDAVDIELWTLFPLEISRRLGDQVPPEVYHHLNALTHVRPPWLAMSWVNSLLKSYIADPEVDRSIKNIWNNAVIRFSNLDFVHTQKRRNGIGLTNIIYNALLSSRFVSFGAAGKMLEWGTEKFWNGNYSLVSRALKEPAFVRQDADFIVYGHTHLYEMVPLDANATVYAKGRVYTNTGSWMRAYYPVASRHQSVKGFVSLQEITGAAFFSGDEHGGQPFETWRELVSVWSQPLVDETSRASYNAFTTPRIMP